MTELEMLKKAMESEMYECAITDHKGIRRMMDIPQAVDLLELAALDGAEEPLYWQYNEENDLSMGAYMVDESSNAMGVTVEFY